MGKNGEIKPNVKVNVSVKSNYCRDFLGPFELRTDDAGLIHLGKLKEVQLIKADMIGNENH